MNVKRPTFLFIFFIFMVSLSSAASADNSSRTVVVELNKATWVSDIDWNPENSSQIEVTIQSRIPKQVYIQEVPDYTGKKGSFNPVQATTISVGENVLHVPVNGRRNLGISIADSNTGKYINKRGGGELPEAKGVQVIVFMIIAIGFYEGFYHIRARIRNALISIRPQRDL